jgi:hypothetical protein
MTNPIETVANGSEIGKIVFKALSEKQRARRATDLTHLYRAVSKMDKTVQEKEFLKVFRQLEDADIGSLIIGRRNNHNRFVWNYNLKQVAQAANGKMSTKELAPAVPEKKAKTVRKVTKRRKPSMFKARSQSVSKVETAPIVEDAHVTKSSSVAGPTKIQLTLELAPEVSAKDIQALIELVNSLQAKK